MNTRLAVVVSALAMACPAAAGAERSIGAREPQPALAVHVHRVAPGRSLDRTVLLTRVPSRGGEPSFWVVESYAIEEKDPRTRLDRHRWIDGRSCSPLSDIAANAPAATDGRPEFAAAEIPPFHGLGVIVSRPGPKGWSSPVSRRAHQGVAHGRDVVEWWLRLEQELAACWRDEPPSLGREPLRPRLTPWQARMAWPR